MFKDWIKYLWNLGMDTSDDINIDIARANYQKHQNDLKRKQNDYIKTLCGAIKVDARKGKKYIDTLNVLEKDFMTAEFIIEMKTYFEQRGFKADVTNCGLSRCWLRISWDEGEEQ